MPTLRRTPFNQSGSYVPDAMDNIEEGNRAAGFQFMGMRQNDLMAQLAMQRLNNENFQYRQGRVDNIGMFNEKLKHDDHITDVNAGLTREGWKNQSDMFGKQFDYMAGRDTRADAQHQQEWDFEHDQNRNPSLMAAFQANAVNKRLADEMERENARRVARDKITDAAGNAAPDMTGWSPDDVAHYKARIGAGAAPSSAGYDVGQERDQRDRDEVESQQQILAGDLADFSRKDNKVFGADATEEGGQVLAGRLAKLEEALRVKLHKGQGAAHDIANSLLTKNTQQSANSQKVDALRRLRGLPE